MILSCWSDGRGNEYRLVYVYGPVGRGVVMSALCDVMSYVVLGWVKFELDEILCQVRGEIEVFVENLVDISCMCFCVGYLHQV